MKPILFTIPIPFLEEGLKVPAYGFMIMIAFIVGTYLAAFRAKKWGIDPNHVIDSGLYAVIFGILGARLLFTIQYFDVYFWGIDSEGYNRFWNIFKIWQGGLVFYGGLIGGAAAIIILMRKRKLNIPLMSDLCLPSVILGLAITRIGCFFNGCCFGKVTDSVFRVRFPVNSFSHSRQFEQIKIYFERHPGLFSPDFYAEKMGRLNEMLQSGAFHIRSPQSLLILKQMKNHLLSGKGSADVLEGLGYHMKTLLTTPFSEFPLPVHPTELYSSLLAFTLFGLLMFLTRYRKFDGQIGAFFCMFYAVNRFVVEFFRSDNNTNLGLTISQWVSLALFIAGAALYVWLRKKGNLSELPLKPEAQHGKPEKNT